MRFKIFAIFAIILLLTITKIKCEIANCLFVNTVDLTNTNETFVSESGKNLTGDYDYIVLRNGTKISVPLHKRGCICANPCLSLCSDEAIHYYYDEEFDYTEGYQRNVRFDGSEEEKDFVKFFNHRINNLKCNNSYPLLMEVYDNDEWWIFENGTLFISFLNEYRNHDEHCFDFYEIPKYGSVILPYICSIVKQRNPLDIVKNFAMACSVPFFLITIFFYCYLRELRNCHGKCFIMYLFYLTVSYSLICYNTLSYVEIGKYECITMGYVIYFSTIAFITWICIISYDTYVSLTDLDCATLFRKYFLKGFIIPGSITFVIFVIQSLKIIDEKHKPGIDQDSCGVKVSRWSAFFYYYIPHIIALVYCVILYIKLIRFLVLNERDVTTNMGRLKMSYMKRFSLYFRLFIFMGVIWFLEILSYLIEMSIGPNIFIILPDLLNGLHGLFIFLSIIFNSRIYNFMRKCCSSGPHLEHAELMTRTCDLTEST